MDGDKILIIIFFLMLCGVLWIGLYFLLYINFQESRYIDLEVDMRVKEAVLEADTTVLSQSFNVEVLPLPPQSIAVPVTVPQPQVSVSVESQKPSPVIIAEGSIPSTCSARQLLRCTTINGRTECEC